MALREQFCYQACALTLLLCTINCSSSVGIQVLPTGNEDVIELLVLNACPSSADELFSCEVEVQERFLSARGTQPGWIPQPTGPHALAAVGHKDCEVVSWSCVFRADLNDDVVLAMTAVETPRQCDSAAATRCGSMRECTRSCGGAVGDDDGDNLTNEAECGTLWPACADLDGDGTDNHRDLDADGDGYSDRAECPLAGNCLDPHTDTHPFLVPHRPNDADEDGLPNVFECPGGELNDLESCADTDGDGVPDWLDINSDNDAAPDALECRYYVEEHRCPRTTSAGYDHVVAGPPRCGLLGVCIAPNRCSGFLCCDIPDVPGLAFGLLLRQPNDVRPIYAAEPDAVSAFSEDGRLCDVDVLGSANWFADPLYLQIFDGWERHVDPRDSRPFFLVEYEGPEMSIDPSAFPPGFPTELHRGRWRSGVVTTTRPLE